MKRLRWGRDILGKYLITFLITGLAVIISGGIIVFADTADSGTCGDNLTWTLSGDGLLVISGTGEMESSKSYPWEESNISVVKVIIEEGVTTIGSYAFEGCRSMTQVTISNTVTSIGDRAFYSCNLKEVNIPDSVVEIGDGAFIFCSYLETVTLGSGLTVIGDDAFKNCYSLKEIVLPDSLTSIGENAFSGCNELTSVVINGSITSIPYQAFSSCVDLTKVTIPASVQSIAYNAFWGCASLKNVYFGGTQAQWENIEIGENNEYLENAQIHYGASQNDTSSENADTTEEMQSDTAEDGVQDAGKVSDSDDENAYSESPSGEAGVFPAVFVLVAVGVIAAIGGIVYKAGKTGKRKDSAADDRKNSAIPDEGDHPTQIHPQIRKRFCPQCGRSVPEGAKFCGECGCWIGNGE